MDFSKIENIIYVAVSCCVALFLFVTVFVVIGKGKRKCGALDVIYRVFVSLCLATFAVLFAAAVFTELDGSVRIDTSVEPCLFVMGGNSVELPFSALFVVLHENYVAEINGGILLLSVIALSADCMLANLKKDKGKKASGASATAKTPEQIKRAAEIERIRRLADSAVQKSETACGAKDEKKEDRTESEKPESAEDTQEDFDWRVETSPQHKTEFVGLESADADDGFDTFDDEPQHEEEHDRFDESNEFTEERYGEEDAESSVDTEPEIDEAHEITDVPQIADGRQDVISDVAEEEKEETFTDGTDDQEYYDGGEPDDVTSGDGAFEPNRDIYIPKIRTIERRSAARSEKTAVEKKSGAAKSGGKSAGKKPTAKGGKPTGKRASTKSKALPVTKKYVILDRTSAVNIFSEYLKERDKAEKDRLESNIETIIIK